MGRHKINYEAPVGLLRQKNSPNWYIKIKVEGKYFYKSTGTSDLVKAKQILEEVRAKLTPDDAKSFANRLVAKWSNG